MKKILKGLLLTMMSCCLVLSLSGCGEKKVKKINVHIDQPQIKNKKSIISGIEENYYFSKKEQEVSKVTTQTAYKSESLVPQDASNKEKQYVLVEIIRVLNQGYEEVKKYVEKEADKQNIIAEMELNAKLSDNGKNVIINCTMDRESFSILRQALKDDKLMKNAENKDEMLDNLSKLLKADPQKCLDLIKDAYDKIENKKDLKIKKIYY